MIYPPMDPRAPEHAKMLAQIQRYRATTRITIQTACTCGRENPPVTVSLERYDLYRNHHISALQMCGGDLKLSQYFLSSTCLECDKEGRNQV